MNWHMVTHTLSGIGGLLLFIAPFIGRTRGAPGFVRVQLFLAGGVVIAWSVIGIYVYSHQADSSHTLLPWPQYWRLMLIRWTLAGVGIGVLTTLFTNPQFYRWRRGSNANI